jgi:hypothetical protein
MMTDDEILSQAYGQGVKAPYPLKMAGMAILEARDVAKSLTSSAIPLDAHTEYREMRRRVDFWTARWQAGVNGTAVL